MESMKYMVRNIIDTFIIYPQLFSFIMKYMNIGVSNIRRYDKPTIDKNVYFTALCKE